MGATSGESGQDTRWRNQHRRVEATSATMEPPQESLIAAEAAPTSFKRQAAVPLCRREQRAGTKGPEAINTSG